MIPNLNLLYFWLLIDDFLYILPSLVNSPWFTVVRDNEEQDVGLLKLDYIIDDIRYILVF